MFRNNRAGQGLPQRACKVSICRQSPVRVPSAEWVPSGSPGSRLGLVRVKSGSHSPRAAAAPAQRWHARRVIAGRCGARVHVSSFSAARVWELREQHLRVGRPDLGQLERRERPIEVRPLPVRLVAHRACHPVHRREAGGRLVALCGEDERDAVVAVEGDVGGPVGRGRVVEAAARRAAGGRLLVKLGGLGLSQEGHEHELERRGACVDELGADAAPQVAESDL
mmetsp:Transcript_1326/g.2848  ORF Transcript_1326/g.2848 Transcript_1326/m.2848 type:complete len:224 (+) Transcript_1326:115-786(+)